MTTRPNRPSGPIRCKFMTVCQTPPSKIFTPPFLALCLSGFGSHLQSQEKNEAGGGGSPASCRHQEWRGGSSSFVRNIFYI